MAELPAHPLSLQEGDFSCSSPPLAASMFHAVADHNVEGMVRLYASSCRDTIRSIMALQQSSTSTNMGMGMHPSFQLQPPTLPHNKGTCIDTCIYTFCFYFVRFNSL